MTEEIDPQEVSKSSLSIDDCSDLDYISIEKLTEHAVCVDLGDGAVWIPRSLVAMMDSSSIWVATWFAAKEDWV